MGDPHVGKRVEKGGQEREQFAQFKKSTKEKRKGSRTSEGLAGKWEEAKWRRLKEQKRASRSTELSLFQEIARLCP